ncbi:MAG: ABC transporter permease, partial [Pedobacter sp.]
NGHAGIIKIGSKIFGEQYILAEIYTMLIQGNTNYQVQTKTGLGGTKICFDALSNNQIDFYPEYTGTGLLAILKPDAKLIAKLSPNKEETYRYVSEEFLKKYKIKWLKPIGFNNSYALMMRQKQSAELNVNTITDLKNYLDKN